MISKFFDWNGWSFYLFKKVILIVFIDYVMLMVNGDGIKILVKWLNGKV